MARDHMRKRAAVKLPYFYTLSDRVLSQLHFETTKIFRTSSEILVPWFIRATSNEKMCALPTSRPKPRKLDLTAPRPPTPTPTADEARGDFFQTLMRFCLLCRSGSQTDVVKILNQWPDLPRTPRPLCGAARFGHVALIEYLLTQGFPLFSEHFSGSVPDSAAIGAEETGNTKVLELLLNHGWDISSGQPASMA